MTHIHWVARQNKLEIPNDEEEVNTREIHKCDGQAHDPDTMIAPLTPKPTRKAEALAKLNVLLANKKKDEKIKKDLSSQAQVSRKQKHLSQLCSCRCCSPPPLRAEKFQVCVWCGVVVLLCVFVCVFVCQRECR